MNTESLIQIPGYKYNEYVLVLNPNKDLQDKIMQMKKDFSEKHKVKTAFYSKPQISLVNFVQFEMMEERLINRLKTIAMGYRAFTVELSGFGSIPSHTIFINVTSKQQVQNLTKELKSAQQLMFLNKSHKPHFINDSNLIIARKLLPWQYEKGWLEYSQQDFSGRFIADGMSLYKRQLKSHNHHIQQPDENHSAQNYQLVQRFEFKNLPVQVRQGDLFS